MLDCETSKLHVGCEMNPARRSICFKAHKHKHCIAAHLSASQCTCSSSASTGGSYWYVLLGLPPVHELGKNAACVNTS